MKSTRVLFLRQRALQSESHASLYGNYKEIEFQKKALDKTAEVLGIVKTDDWYKITGRIARNHSPFITNYYGGSLLQALRNLYPEYTWDPMRFKQRPKNYWKDNQMKKLHLDRIANQLGIQKLDDWYSVTWNQIHSKVPFLCNYYNSSIIQMLSDLYPEHKWDPLKFTHVPRGYWQNINTEKHFQQILVGLGAQYNVQELRDWYHLPPQELKLFQRVAKSIHGSVSKMIERWFPETNWINQMQGSNPELELQVSIFSQIFIH
jgi:hypothetical protein